MSDEEFYSEESYEFEFEDEEDSGSDNAGCHDEQLGAEDENTSLETMYYNAKSLKYDDTNAAIEALRKVILVPATTPDDIKYSFKSHKQLVKISFHAGDFDASLASIKNMLNVLPEVSGTYGEDSLNKMVHNLSTAANPEFVAELYNIILLFLEQDRVRDSPGFDRLWLRITVNKLRVALEERDLPVCAKLIAETRTKLENVSEFNRKQYLLDVIAAEIEYLSLLTPLNLTKLNQLYKQSIDITTAVTHPRLIGVIQECGAKLYFYKGNYEKARLEFYDSFNSYDEAGSPLKKKILKYLTLCSLLTENQFNPFESQETNTYSTLPEYTQLLQLIRAYDESDLAGLITVIQTIMSSSDPLAKDDIFLHASKQIVVNLKAKLIKNYMKAYSVIKLNFLEEKLHLSSIELENLLRRLVITGKLQNVKLDFVRGIAMSGNSTAVHFPLSLSPKEIHYNMKMASVVNVLQVASRTGKDGMDIDRPKQNYSSKDANKFLFPVERPGSDIDCLKLVELWFLYVHSCIPVPVKNELSQKDQVAFEQKAELAEGTGPTSNLVNDDLIDTTQLGILNSTIESEEGEENNTKADSIRKADVLSSWLNELCGYHAALV